jgi:hypothetical protein
MIAPLRAFLLMTAALASVAAPATATDDARLAGSARGARNGWITVRLQGAPADVGYQHGTLLSTEIADAVAVAKLNLTHDGKRDWAFFRKAAETVFWPRVDAEYRQEMQGIAEGAAAAGAKVDLWDVVALNASIELPYYTATLDQDGRSGAPDKCSAFVATGRHTRDGMPVVAHNNWSGYLEGSRWNVVFDIRPAAGHRFLMDGMPGLIHSGDDFGVNSAGLVITETTITGFQGFDPRGIPEFARARKAMQYAASIDDFDRIMREGNNGGYANAWLVADMNTREIARLELGLKTVTLERTKDGYFVGTNFPVNAKLAAEETKFRLDDPSLSANARRVRAEQLVKENAGRIDVPAAKAYLSDHFDSYEKKPDAPSERSLCGHVDLSPRGMGDWFSAYGPAGTVQAKVADATLAKRMAFEAAMGHPCGTTYLAAPHLAKHPDYAWTAPLMRDLVASPWTLFEAP